MVRALIIAAAALLVACPPPDGPILDPPRGEGNERGIGTWPTPEMNFLRDEQCDGIDNDGDGSVDEGCPCDHSRSCEAAFGDECRRGVQRCEYGVLSVCDGQGRAVPAAVGAVEIVSVAPTSLERGATSVAVELAVTPRCADIPIERAGVFLVAESPAMRVKGVAARADGYVASVPVPFGPGVAAQDIEVRAGAWIDDEWVEERTTLPFDGGAPH